MTTAWRTGQILLFLSKIDTVFSCLSRTSFYNRFSFL